MKFKVISHFWYFFVSSWLVYFILLPLVSIYKLYEIFPAIAFIGYSIMIISNLVAINFSHKRLHYILLSVSLIIMGAIASLDIVLNKEQMAILWQNWNLVPLTPELLNGYVQVLIILLNIFTGSIAAQCLFHGLNGRTFESRDK